MGIIILPFLLGALGLSVYAVVKVVSLFRNGIVTPMDIIFGLALSVGIFGLICLSYKMEARAWALSPSFRVPIFMVFVPFVIYLFTRNSSNEQLKYLSNLILISISLTGILGLIFNNLIFGLVDILGIEKFY